MRLLFDTRNIDLVRIRFVLDSKVMFFFLVNDSWQGWLWKAGAHLLLIYELFIGLQANWLWMMIIIPLGFFTDLYFDEITWVLAMSRPSFSIW